MTALFTGEIHPLADGLPMLGADEMEDLKDSIRRNGLIDPITLDPDGVLLDGRNRLAACTDLGIVPRFEIYDGDPIELVVARGATRRNVSTGQRAMLIARGMWARGEWDPIAERWKHGAVQRIQSVAGPTLQVNRLDLAMAGAVLAYSEDWAAEVLSGTRTLRATYDTVVADRKSAARADDPAEAARVAAARDRHPSSRGPR